MSASRAPLLRKKGPLVSLVRVRHARSGGARFKGLLGESPERFDYALVFHLDSTGILGASIHMLFMRMPIDVIWLDEKRRIVDRAEGLPPWTLNRSPAHPARFFVELPTGTISNYRIEEGDQVNW